MDFKFDSLRNRSKELVNKIVKQSNESKDMYLELEEEVKRIVNELNESKEVNEVMAKKQNEKIKVFEKKLNQKEEDLKNKEKELNEFKEKVYFNSLIIFKLIFNILKDCKTRITYS